MGAAEGGVSWKAADKWGEKLASLLGTDPKMTLAELRVSNPGMAADLAYYMTLGAFKRRRRHAIHSKRTDLQLVSNTLSERIQWTGAGEQSNKLYPWTPALLMHIRFSFHRGAGFAFLHSLAENAFRRPLARCTGRSAPCLAAFRWRDKPLAAISQARGQRADLLLERTEC